MQLMIIHVTEQIELMLDVNVETGKRSSCGVSTNSTGPRSWRQYIGHSELTTFLCPYNNLSHISETSRHPLNIWKAESFLISIAVSWSRMLPDAKLTDVP